MMRDTFDTSLNLLTDKPSLGIRVVHTDRELDYLLDHTPNGYMWAKAVVVLVLTGAIMVGVMYCTYKLSTWQKDRKLQEHQEVFNWSKKS